MFRGIIEMQVDFVSVFVFELDEKSFLLFGVKGFVVRDSSIQTELVVRS